MKCMKEVEEMHGGERTTLRWTMKKKCMEKEEDEEEIHGDG